MDAETCSLEVPEQVRPAVCPECGYSLNALPVEGKCPECGWAYGPDTIVLFGWSCTPMGARRGSWTYVGFFWLPIVAGVQMLLMLGQMWTSRKFEWWFFALMIFNSWMLVFEPLKMLLHRRKAIRSMPGPTQMRFRPEGYQFRDGLGHSKLRPWKPGVRFVILRNRRGALVVGVRRFLIRFEVETEISEAFTQWVKERVEGWIRDATKATMP